MSAGIIFVFAVVASVGVPVLTLGVVLRLVEWGLSKPRWSLGSSFFIAVGGLLCLPLFIWIACGLAVRLGR
jgi:hypothetical protein